MLREHLSHRHTGVPSGFRPRGTDVTRIEGFSDAVFAFSLTLLVVSLEVPHTYRELTRAMQGFFAFGISFALLMQIWFKHYGFFRRYGLQDPPTRVLNSVLLFIVLFYVYPLKYLWSHVAVPGAGGAFSPSEARVLMEIYGLGGAAVFLIFVLLYRHAWRLRDELALNDIERYDTRQSIIDNALMAGVPAVSVLLAASLSLAHVGWAGLFYFMYGPLMTWNGMRESRGRRRLEERAREGKVGVE